MRNMLLLIFLTVVGCSRSGKADYVEVEIETPPAPVEQFAPRPPETKEAEWDPDARRWNNISKQPDLAEVTPVEIEANGHTIKAPPGSKIRFKNSNVEQPPNPKDAATINMEGGNVSTGTAYEVLQSIGQLSILIWIGAFVVVLGFVGLGLSFKIPMIPKKAAALCIVGGFALIATPWFLEEYGWIIVIFVVVLMIAALYYVYTQFMVNQKAHDANIRGIQEFKRHNPEAGAELVKTLRQSQDDDVQDHIKKEKSRIR